MAVIDAVDFSDAIVSGGVHQSRQGRVQAGVWKTSFVPIGPNTIGFMPFRVHTLQIVPQDAPVDQDSSPTANYIPASGELFGVPSRFSAGRVIDGVDPSRGDCPFPSYSVVFWFDRLHVLPGSAQSNDLGNVVSDVDTGFEIFNAHRFLDADIASLDITNPTGFTVLSGAVPPSPELTIPAYGGEIYSIRAEAELGPPTINTTFTWVPSTAGFDSVSVTFSGNRISIFTYIPQIEPVTRYEWLTKVIEAYDGTEQRTAMRRNPRQSITYRLKLGGNDTDYAQQPQQFEQAIFDGMGRVFAVPLWEDRTELTAAVSANDLTVNCDTTNRAFVVGQLVMLWRDYLTFEALEIESLTASTITVASAFQASFAVDGTIVLPMMNCYVDDNIQQQVYRKDFATWELTFRRITQVMPDLIGSPAGFGGDTDFYLGLPVWPRQWEIQGNSTGRTWRRNIEQFPSQLGRLAQDFRLTVPKRRSAMMMRIRGRDDFLRARSLLMYLRGKQRIFWMPSKVTNFTLAVNATGGSSAIRVNRNQYDLLVTEREPLNHIQITLTDGQIFRHEIISSSDAGSGLMDLSLDPNVGVPGGSPPQDYTTSNVARIEFLTKHRLDVDTYEFQAIRPRWHYDLVIPIVELQNEVAA